MNITMGNITAFYEKVNGESPNFSIVRQKKPWLILVNPFSCTYYQRTQLSLSVQKANLKRDDNSSQAM